MGEHSLPTSCLPPPDLLLQEISKRPGFGSSLGSWVGSRKGALDYLEVLCVGNECCSGTRDQER